MCDMVSIVGSESDSLHRNRTLSDSLPTIVIFFHTAHRYCTPPQGELFEGSNHGYPRYGHALSYDKYFIERIR